MHHDKVSRSSSSNIFRRQWWREQSVCRSIPVRASNLTMKKIRAGKNNQQIKNKTSLAGKNNQQIKNKTSLKSAPRCKSATPSILMLMPLKPIQSKFHDEYHEIFKKRTYSVESDGLRLTNGRLPIVSGHEFEAALRFLVSKKIRCSDL